MRGFDVNTINFKYVRDYAGYSFAEIRELDIEEFLILQRDAYIYKLQQTEAGREYLDKCFVLEQTSADRTALKKLREEA